MFGAEFYPTPVELLEKITKDMDWKKIKLVLEPSAGKGDIADFVKQKLKGSHGWTYSDHMIHCVELHSDLALILKGKGYPVVYNDFLSFDTRQQYDLIIMNPPFSNGATHLLKALSMQEHGGAVLCILNAETLRNLCTNERKALWEKLTSLNAEIEYMEHEFSNAERTTNVEIAVVKAVVPAKERVSIFFDELRETNFAECRDGVASDLVLNDYIMAAVSQYNVEVSAGIRLIEEYCAMKPYILNMPNYQYSSPLLELTCLGESELSVNKFVESVRMKYWEMLFKNEQFTKHMTQNLVKQYYSRIEQLKSFDFSVYNIKEIQLQMSQSVIQGIEDCIVSLFDEFSVRHYWDGAYSSNIHYYNGWKTNKSYIVNRKVIIPLSAYSDIWKRFDVSAYEVVSKLCDIEKVFNYLDGGLTEHKDIKVTLSKAKTEGQTKKIALKYFTVTFFKKGTCHIEFSNEELLKKFNIFGSQQKGWLPPAYGKMDFQNFTKEEQDVITSFEGVESYMETCRNAGYYLADISKSLPRLSA